MRDHMRSQKMKNHRPGRHGKYEKEMDQAFTLIFHNIKRLQDGHLFNSASSLITPDDAEMNPASTLKLPLERPRASTDPLNRLTEGSAQQHMKVSDTRPKSQSFTSEASPSSQRRKVTFADDYTAKEQVQRSGLTRQTTMVRPSNRHCFEMKGDSLSNGRSNSN